MKTFKSRYTCPSNIAIVKYWGKHGLQLPRNASISFTLTNAKSDTTIEITSKTTSQSNIQFFFEGQEKPSFLPKINQFLKLIEPLLNWLPDYDLLINSSNTFPHSSGIASSASGMAAMAMCLCDIENQMFGTDIDIYKASKIARLGSGSACRSLFEGMAVWGHHMDYDGSSDEYAIGVKSLLHEVFNSYHDDILIVSSAEKSVSSTAGHGLMDNNNYAEVRYHQASQHMADLRTILEQGDIERFGILAESEAMVLHALMMCSTPSYLLMEGNTIEVIKAIRQYRQESGVPIYFTLDAGPNVHILYPHEYEEKCRKFIDESLMSFSPNSMVIRDHVGIGPVKLSV